MEATVYELTYDCVKIAHKAVQDIEKVVALFKADPTKKFTCQEIGRALYGDEYTHMDEYDPRTGRSIREARLHNAKYSKHISHLGHILSHLIDNHCVIKMKEKTTEPVLAADGTPITYEKWVQGTDTEQLYIMVTDEKGRSTQIRNPWYNGNSGHYEDIPILKTIVTYQWVEGK